MAPPRLPRLVRPRRRRLRIGPIEALDGTPVIDIKPVLGDFIANGKSTSQPRPWIGINTQEVQGNVIVTRVSPESPAEEASLKTGDIIVSLGGGPDEHGLAGVEVAGQ